MQCDVSTPMLCESSKAVGKSHFCQGLTVPYVESPSRYTCLLALTKLSLQSGYYEGRQQDSLNFSVKTATSELVRLQQSKQAIQKSIEALFMKQQVLEVHALSSASNLSKSTL